MKSKLMTFATILTFASTAVLAESGEGGGWRETCTNMSDLAEKIMEARQAGVDMSRMMEVADGEVIEDLIIAAYDMPRYNTETHQRRTINDFKNQAYADCVRTMRN